MERARFLWVLVITATCSIPGAVHSQGCLQCWYGACNPAGSTINPDDCCGCLDPPAVGSICRNQFEALPSDSAQCCSVARDTLLGFYQLEVSDGGICSNGAVLNDPNSLSGTGILEVGKEYIIPSFTFDCSGCIEGLELLVDISDTTVFSTETVNVQLWRKYENMSIIEDDVLYERNESFTIIGTPETVTVVDADFQTVRIVASGPGRACFEPGDVFGFSVPVTSDLRIVENSPGDAFVVPEPLIECELNPLFQPTTESDTVNTPQIAISIGPSLVSVSTSTVVVAPTSSQGGPTSTEVEMRSTPVSQPTPTGIPAATGDSLPLVVILAAAIGGLICFLLVVIVITLCLCIVQRHRHHKAKLTLTSDIKMSDIPAGRRPSNSTVGSLPRSQMMDSLVHTRQTSLAESAPSLDATDHLYDLPDELAIHPMRSGPSASGRVVEKKSARPLSRGNEYQSSGKYMTMHPVGSISSKMQHGTTQTLQTIYSEDFQQSDEEEEEDDKGDGDGYSVDYEQQMVDGYDMPTELIRRPQPTIAPFYHVLENPKAENESSNTEALKEAQNPPHFYHILESDDAPTSPVIANILQQMSKPGPYMEPHQYHVLEEDSAVSLQKENVPPPVPKGPRHGSMEGVPPPVPNGPRRGSKQSMENVPPPVPNGPRRGSKQSMEGSLPQVPSGPRRQSMESVPPPLPKTPRRGSKSSTDDVPVPQTRSHRSHSASNQPLEGAPPPPRTQRSLSPGSRQSFEPAPHYHVLEESIFSESSEELDLPDNKEVPYSNFDEDATTESSHVVDCGIYVPTTEERRQFAGEKEEVTMDIYDSWSRIKHQDSSKKRGFFQESKKYWKPSSKASKLYDQLAKKKFREILRDQIEIRSFLGHGQFGTVAKATWNFPGGPMEVAAKLMKPSGIPSARVTFLQEAAIMGQFFHPNLIKLHGVVTMGDPAMIVMELMPYGDLASYMKKTYDDPSVQPLPHPEPLLSFSRQVACGMNYLAKKSYVHRDLAARNILLNESLVCKICDFGMSRGLLDSNYYMSKGGAVPIKWTAPEALNYKKYSSASDAYSYGMVEYEI